jgi:hypothetical protein
LDVTSRVPILHALRQTTNTAAQIGKTVFIADHLFAKTIRLKSFAGKFLCTFKAGLRHRREPCSAVNSQP